MHFNSLPFDVAALKSVMRRGFLMATLICGLGIACRRAQPQETPALSSAGGFTDTVLLKNGETLTNVKATITRDAIVIVDANGTSRAFTKDQVAGVRNGR